MEELDFPLKTQDKKEYIYNFLKKSPYMRSHEEIKKASKFLSDNYQYFIDLKSNKEFGYQKIEKIIKFSKLEIFLTDETIIKYGEIGDKFYILLEGGVALYKPIYVEAFLSPIEFSDLLIKIRDEDRDKYKYERLIEKNNHLNFDIRELEGMKGVKPDFLFIKTKIFLEDLDKFGEFGEGFSFGEMAIMRKTTRNATIKTTTKSYLLSIEKKDYNRAIRELQEKKLNQDVEQFYNTYPIFKILTKDKIYEILNDFSTKIIYKDEYLYKQDDDADYVYFLNKGIIDINFNVSFSWLNEYLYYFNNIDGNLLFYIFYQKPTKYSELVEIFEKARKDMNKWHYLNKSNQIKIEENLEKWEECYEKENRDNLLGVKNEENQLNNKNKIFSVNLKSIQPQKMIGLLEAIESKKRFFNAKCVSDHAELRCIKIYDLIKIFCILKEDEIYDFISYIFKMKYLLKIQLINKLKYLEKNILFNLNNKYDFLRGDENNVKNEGDKSRIISIIKMKGFKTNIQELLDKELIIPFSPSLLLKTKGKKGYWNNSNEKELIRRNQKEMKILKKIYNTSFSNPHLVKFKNKKELVKNISYHISNYTAKNNKNYFFSPSFKNRRKKTILRKTFSFINFRNNNINTIKIKNDNIYNSFQTSPNKVSLNKKIFSNIVNFNNNIITEDNSIGNKILSTYTSPLKEKSSNFSENFEDNKNNKRNISFSDIKNQNLFRKGHQYPKIVLKKSHNNGKKQKKIINMWKMKESFMIN